jgi:hypothetical protein
MQNIRTNFSLKVSSLLVEVSRPFVRLALRMYSSLSVSLSSYAGLSKSKSKLLYDWRFTANQFVLASSPLRPTTDFFFNWSSSYSDRAVDNLPYCSVTACLPNYFHGNAYCWRGCLRCWGNVFIQPLLSIGCLLNCDWLAFELMWAVPTKIHSWIFQTENACSKVFSKMTVA